MAAELNTNSQFVEIEGRRGGSFSLARPAAHALQHLFKQQPLRASIMSHTLRRMQRDISPTLIFLSDLESSWVQKLPNPQEQADVLIF
jgi:hypothetical protein